MLNQIAKRRVLDYIGWTPTTFRGKIEGK